MLHPSQFEVNEAWIAFRLNGAPIRTERDGDFHCLALMDAASCFILCMEMVSMSDSGPSRQVVRRLLDAGEAQGKARPKTLFVAKQEASDSLATEASSRSIEIVGVPESELLAFVSDARKGFAERFEEPTQ